MSAVCELDELAPAEQSRSDRDPWPWSKFQRYYRVRAGWDYENEPQEAAFIDVMIRTLYDARQYRLGRPAPEIDLVAVRERAEAYRAQWLSEHPNATVGMVGLLDQVVSNKKDLALIEAKRDAGIPQSGPEERTYMTLKALVSKDLYHLEALSLKQASASSPFGAFWPEAAAQ
jgi:hypothetical protein